MACAKIVARNCFVGIAQVGIAQYDFSEPFRTTPNMG